MPVSNAVQEWTLTMVQGSAQNWAFVLTQSGVPGGNAPYPIDAAAWQYVVRQVTDDTTGTPLVSITPTANSQGQLVVTSTASLSQVVLEMYGITTQGLAPGTYTHTLWEFPGQARQYPWFTGSLIIVQPALP